MNNLPIGWQVKSLGELLASLESGGRAKGGSVAYGIPSIGAEHLDDYGRLHFSSMKYVPKDYYYSMNTGKIFKGDILVVKDGATTGKVSFVDNDFPYQESAVNEHVFIVRTNKHLLDPQFAFYYLYSSIGKLQILADFRGSAQGGISRGFVDKVHLPLPPLPMQKQIAEILEKADEAKQKRKEANKLTDEFLQSVFIEMFGDPAKNPKGWETKKLQQICIEIADIDHNMPKAVEKGVPFISAKDLLDDGSISFDEVKNISEEDYTRLSKKIKPQRGDIIYSRIGAKLGKARLVKTDKKFLASYSCCTIRPNNNLINLTYLCSFLDSKFCLRQATENIRGIGVPDLGMDRIKSFIIPYPPISLQQHFAEIVNKTEALKEKQKQSEQELENLFQSLMQRAFKGELVS